MLGLKRLVHSAVACCCSSSRRLSDYEHGDGVLLFCPKQRPGELNGVDVQKA